MAIFSRGQDWEDMPLELKKELISAFSLPSLSVLVLGDIINFPSIILRCAVHVREVIVGRVKFSDSTEESLLRDWGIMKPTQKALRALTLYQQSLEDECYAEWLSSWAGLDSLLSSSLFVNLRRVKIEIWVGNLQEDEGPYEVLEQKLGSIFGLVQEKGLLQFTWDWSELDIADRLVLACTCSAANRS
ncbi:hypothetical protein BDQ17DRAFT_1514634 [Cyathus striatus]|nr:hypothetical protein BDQ17DRAFT_1514634 [Cyathus striatus]